MSDIDALVETVPSIEECDERIADAQGVLDAPSGEYDIEVRVSADKDRRRWKKNREWAVVVRELAALARQGQQARAALDDAHRAAMDMEAERDRLKAALDRVINAGVETWHTVVNDEPQLSAWLGLTNEEYSAWVEGGADRIARAALADEADA